MRTALALPARVERPADDEHDDELEMLTERVRALRRLHPVKARVLGLIVSEMLREASERAPEVAR
jgi:hypothetical protein